MRFLTTEIGLSGRRNCRIVGLARSVQQNLSVDLNEAALVERLRILASENQPAVPSSSRP